MLVRNFIILCFFTWSTSCSLPTITRDESKPKSHILKLKECIDSFMTEHGVELSEAFEVCEKLYRR